MSTAYQNYVTADKLLHTSYAMIALTTIVFLTRTSIRCWSRKSVMPEDYIVTLAYLFFLTTSVLYVVVTPTLFRVTEAASGVTEIYPEMLDDSLFMIKVFFTTSMLFWITLWSVKFAFLALYYRLMTGLRRYMQLWWLLTGFCALSLVGCIISNFTSCHSMHAWFTPGLCTTSGDVRAQIASLYYAFAVDVITDLLIMFLPLHLLYTLRRPIQQKIGMAVLFGIGWICIAMAVIRVVQIGSKSQSSSTPSSSWLALWAVVESAVAVIVGCGPGLYVTAREIHVTRTQVTIGQSSGDDAARDGFMSSNQGALRSYRSWKMGQFAKRDGGAAGVEMNVLEHGGGLSQRMSDGSEEHLTKGLDDVRGTTGRRNDRHH